MYTYLKLRIFMIETVVIINTLELIACILYIHVKIVNY